MVSFFLMYFPVFLPADTYIQKTKKSFMDSRARRNLNNIHGELNDVQRIMMENIDDVLQRGAQLSGETGCRGSGETGRRGTHNIDDVLQRGAQLSGETGYRGVVRQGDRVHRETGYTGGTQGDRERCPHVRYNGTGNGCNSVVYQQVRTVGLISIFPGRALPRSVTR